MAEDSEHDTGGILGGKDPKKKMMMVGVGVAALLVVFLLMRRGSSSAQPAATQTAPTPQQPIADVTVPSDQQSSSDLLAQWATAQQALMQQYASGAKTGGTSQPGAPPAQGSDPGPNQIGGFWYTFQTGDNPTTMTAKVYDQPANAPWLQVDQMQIMQANPQVNWQQMIQPGTPVYIPPMPWDIKVGPKPGLTANESWQEPGITAANNSS